MSKSILVIDTPRNCTKCILCGKNIHLEKVCYGKVEKSKEYGSYYPQIEEVESKPDWCPLNEIPQKKVMDMREELSMFYSRYIEGYNACIGEILKECDWL